MDKSRPQVNLTTEEAAERLRLSKATLDTWRCRGGGPVFIKLGRSVRYPVANIEDFERRNMRTSTSQG